MWMVCKWHWRQRQKEHREAATTRLHSCWMQTKSNTQTVQQPPARTHSPRLLFATNMVNIHSVSANDSHNILVNCSFLAVHIVHAPAQHHHQANSKPNELYLLCILFVILLPSYDKDFHSLHTFLLHFFLCYYLFSSLSSIAALFFYFFNCYFHWKEQIV